MRVSSGRGEEKEQNNNIVLGAGGWMGSGHSRDKEDPTQIEPPEGQIVRR